MTLEVHLYAAGVTLAVCGLAHLVGTVVLRRAEAAGRDRGHGGVARTQAALAALVVRMLLAAPPLGLMAVLAPRLFGAASAAEASPESLRLAAGLWAVGGYALLTAAEAVAAVRWLRRGEAA